MIRSEINDYDLMRYIGSPDHHADCGLAAYALASPEPDHYSMQIRMLNLGNGSEMLITAGGRKENHPRFSPDGNWLAFVSDAAGQDQIWLYEMASGSVRCLTDLPCGAGEPVWSPDGSRICFVAEEPLSDGSGAADSEIVIIEDFGYKSEKAMGFAQKTAAHIWVVPLNGGPACRLTDGDRDHVMPAWSPDGNWLALASNRCRARSEYIGMDLFKVPAAGGEMCRLTENLWLAWYPKPFPPMFTPDGQTIVFAALAPSLAAGMPPTHLFRIPAGGGGAVSLWPADAPCHEATCFIYNSENFGSFPGIAQISEDGRQIYFLSGWHGASNIYRANIFGDPEIRQVTSGKHSFRNLCRPQNGRMLVARGSFSATPQLEMLDPATGESVRLTDSNPWLATRTLSAADEFWLDTLDGKGRVHGFVLPPQQLAAGRSYPAILYIHGGPMPFYGFALTYEYQLLTAAGFGVLLCNPRGSGGYGEAHGDMKQAFDNTAMVDLLQFTREAAKAFPWIDENRLGVAGGSYGGYMTIWLAAHTRIFKAAAAQRSLASQLIAYASSDMAGSSIEFKDFTDFMKDAIKKSPAAYADQINIPFLILHSIKDMRCPVENAHQLYTAIKDTQPELPVRMVLFPDSNHSLTTEGPMRLRKAHYRETLDWFAKHLPEVK